MEKWVENCFVTLNNRDTQLACWQVHLKRIESFMAFEKIMFMERPPFIYCPGTLTELILRALWMASTSQSVLTKYSSKLKMRRKQLPTPIVGQTLNAHLILEDYNLVWSSFSSEADYFRMGCICVSSSSWSWHITLKGKIREHDALAAVYSARVSFQPASHSQSNHPLFKINLILCKAKGYKLKFKFWSFYNCLQRRWEWILSSESSTCQNVMFVSTLAKVTTLDAWFVLHLFCVRLAEDFSPLGNSLWDWVNI